MNKIDVSTMQHYQLPVELARLYDGNDGSHHMTTVPDMHEMVSMPNRNELVVRHPITGDARLIPTPRDREEAIRMLKGLQLDVLELEYRNKAIHYSSKKLTLLLPK